MLHTYMYVCTPITVVKLEVVLGMYMNIYIYISSADLKPLAPKVDILDLTPIKHLADNM